MRIFFVLFFVFFSAISLDAQENRRIAKGKNNTQSSSDSKNINSRISKNRNKRVKSVTESEPVKINSRITEKRKD